MQRSILAALAALAAAAGLAGAPAEAQAPLTRRLVIANEDVWTVNAAFAHLSPEARVSRLNDRLAAILGTENLAARNVYVVQRGRFADLYVGGSHLFTATPQDVAASSRGRSTVELARQWAARLRQVLPLAVKGSNADMPVRRPSLVTGARIVG